MSYKGIDLIKSATKMGRATLNQCKSSYSGEHSFEPTANGNDMKCVICGTRKKHY